MKFGQSYISVGVGQGLRWSFLLALALGLGAFYHVTGASLHSDAANFWLPIAETLTDGGQLYLGDAIDNKPPLWHYLNLLAAATGAYAVAWHATIALVNGIGAGVLSELAPNRRVGGVAGVLYLLALPVVNGFDITVRSMAMTAVLMGIWVDRPLFRGAWFAVGALISQYAGIALLYFGVQALRAQAWRRFVDLAGSAAAIAVVTYLSLVPIWGLESLLAGLEWTIVGAATYSTGIGTTYLNDVAATSPSPRNPIIWIRSLAFVAPQLLFVLLPTGLALFIARDRVSRSVLSLGALFALTLLVRSYTGYWIYPLPFIALVGAVGIEQFLTRVRY